VVVPTGIAMNIPNGFYGKIEDRSSLASMGLRTGAGVVDAGYLGELGVVMHNLNNISNSSYRGLGYQVNKGQRIAQIVINPVVPAALVEVEELNNTERGSRGFGSSGR
jgi:dUTP pyrophosphatase